MGIEIDLSGRVVLVTGGTRGIGGGIARLFLKAGAQVHVCSRNPPGALPEFDGRQAYFHAADVRDPGQVDELIAEIRHRSGRLDTVVNNAGGAPPTETTNASPRFHAKVVELNLLAPLLVCQRAWPVMRDEGGSIIMISSIAARRPAPTIAAYGAAKAGLDNLTQTLALEFAPSVRVNSVTVGLAETEIYEQSYGQDAKMSGFGETIPMGRAATPEDVGNVCVFLASPLAAYLTGTTMSVDGGGEPPPQVSNLVHTPGVDS